MKLWISAFLILTTSAFAQTRFSEEVFDCRSEFDTKHLISITSDNETQEKVASMFFCENGELTPLHFSNILADNKKMAKLESKSESAIVKLNKESLLATVESGDLSFPLTCMKVNKSDIDAYSYCD